MAWESEEIFDNQYSIYIRRYLSIVGLWPYEEPSKRLPYIYCTLGIMISAIIVQTYILLNTEFEVKRITDLLQLYLPTLCFTLTYCTILYNSGTMRETLDHIRDDWNNLANEEELKCMQKYAGISRMCFMLIASVCYVYTIVLICPSCSTFFLYKSGIINNTELSLPVRTEAFVATDTRYLFMLIVEFVPFITASIIGTAFYTMVALSAHHAYALFDIVTIKMKQPFSQNDCQFYWISSDTKRENEIQWIVEIIRYHDDAINFIRLLKSLFGGSYVVQVLLALLLIVVDFVCFFQIIDMMLTTVETVQHFLYIVGTLFMIYVAFYLGQSLIDHSINIYTKCCMIPFYMLSTKTNNLLLLLIMKSQKPCEFSVGGIIVASHELLTKMTKISFSFATLFYNMR